MSQPIIKRPLARLDLLESYLYLATESENTAERFLDCAERTIEHIAEMPSLGALRDFRNPSLHGLRSRPVDGFPNWLDFYHVTPDAVKIIRVLHGARDLDRIFEHDSD
jgi:toxin ParE1/3/4